MTNKDQYDYTIPETDDPAVLKKRGTELQNLQHVIVEDLRDFEQYRLFTEALLDYISDKALILVEQSGDKYDLSAKATPTIKRARSRFVKVDISKFAGGYYDKEQKWHKSTKDNPVKLGYYEVREILNVCTYTYNRCRNK